MKKLLICLLIFVGAIFISCNFVINATTTKTVPEQPTIQTEPLSLIVEASAPSTDILLEEEPAPTPEQEPLATREEIELLALCAMAEAEGECEQGQRLVIDSVLNRVDNPHFPDTISEVIWQKNQYAGMYGDRIARCYPDAVHTEISVEYPLNCPEAYAATVMVSPTRDLGEDGYEDYDWSDLELSLSDIEALIGMAKS